MCPVCQKQLRLAGSERHPVRGPTVLVQTLNCDGCLFVVTQSVDAQGTVVTGDPDPNFS
jgi:C4-type Zn-finger protein